MYDGGTKVISNAGDLQYWGYIPETD